MRQQSDTQVRRVGFFGWIGRLKWIMVTISLVGLLASNIAAVLSASFHDLLYTGVRKMLLIAGESAADAATRRSKAVEVDKKVRDQTADLRKQAADSETRRVRAEVEARGTAGHPISAPAARAQMRLCQKQAIMGIGFVR